MPTATTSSPFCSASSIVLCSLAFFICGRIMMKYMTTNMRTMGIMPRYWSSPWGAAPVVACAKAVEIILLGFSEGKGLIRQGNTLRLKPDILAWRTRDSHSMSGWKPAMQPRGSAFFGSGGSALRGEPGAPGGEALRLDRRAQAFNQLEIVVQVVDRVQARAQDFLGAVEMMQVGAREIAARVARALRVEGPGVLAVASVLDLHVAGAREEPAVARVAGRQHAIEHVDAVRHRI